MPDATMTKRAHADILIVTVTKVESLAVLAAFSGTAQEKPAIHTFDGKTYHDFGVVNGVSVWMVRSEMGASGLGAAQQSVTKAVRALSPGALIMAGIAFGLDEGRQKIGDILVSENLRPYELQRVGTGERGKAKIVPRGDRPHCSSWLLDAFKNADLGWKGATVRFGCILTGEKLVDNLGFRNQLQSLEPEAIGGEMEGAGLYVACQEAKVDWILVKGICDWADGQKERNRKQRQDIAARNAAEFVVHVLQTVGLKREGLSESSGGSNGRQAGKLPRDLTAAASRRPAPSRGERSVVVGGHAAGSQVITGDRNVVIQGTGKGPVAVGPGAVAAGKGGVAVGGDVHGNVTINPDASAAKAAERNRLIARYLETVTTACAGLRLSAIDQGAAQPGRKALELNQVYVDLDVDLSIPKQISLDHWLRTKDRQSKRNEGEPPGAEREEQRRVPLLEALGLHPNLVVLGAPGSGKSTFVSHVAMALAKGWTDRGELHRRLGSWWTAGPRLPVRVVLRQFAASLPAGLVQGRAGDLWTFIARELEASGQDASMFEALRATINESGALFLLDGLDEARDGETRCRLLEAVTEFSATAGKNCRFLITSRPYAWRDVEELAGRGPGSAAAIANTYPHYTLAEFDTGQREQFTARWFQAVHDAGWISEAEAAEKTANLGEAMRRQEYGRLAGNPLLLTLMATLLANRMRLPDDRTDLYDQVVDLLLRRWNEAIGFDRGLLHALQIPSLKLSDVRGAMESVAFHAHAAHQGREGVADIAEGQLVAELRPMLEDRADKADLVLDYIEQRAGLLLGQGPRKGLRQYTFPHRTFQEFLAACYLKDRDEFSDEAAKLAEAAPAHWREVLRFAARLAGPNRGVSAADALVHCQDVEAWCRGSQPRDRDWERAVLAGEQLLEIGLAAVVRQERSRTIKARVAGWLAALVEGGQLAAVPRANAGMVLGRLGDPRKGVGLTSEGVPDLEWLTIEAGPFLYGDDRRVCDLIKARFQIGKYPITVAQYQAFVDAGGYAEQRYWTKAGWEWRTKDKDEKTKDYEPEFQTPNHPRVGVSWYEAVAFCRWLAEQMQREVRLPSEFEWERAARHTDGRAYPWGNEEECAHRCNMDETGIGHTSAVGMFPSGNAACGAADMAGNVLEWCSSKGGAPKDEGLEGSDPYVLRGGSFHGGRDYVRCAFRDGDLPYLRYALIGFRVVVSPF